MAGRLINGWTYTAIFSMRSGQPFTILSGRDNSQTGSPNIDLAEQIAPDSSRLAGADKVQKLFNAPIFTADEFGTSGNMRRNALTGRGFVDFDMGLVKAIPVTAQDPRVLQFALKLAF